MTGATAPSYRVIPDASDGPNEVTAINDGVGGADVAEGTGVRALQDRVAAIGGRMSIDSPA